MGKKRNEFACVVSNKFDCLGHEKMNVESEWQLMKRVLMDTAKEVVGKSKKHKRNTWISDKTLNLVEEKRSQRHKDVEKYN